MVIKRGSLIYFTASTTAGLKRSTCPTCNTRLWRLAAWIKSRASSIVTAIGFSTSVCTPCSKKYIPIWWCNCVGAATITASTCPTRSSGLVYGVQLCAHASFCARITSGSHTPTSVTPFILARVRVWKVPILPAPITPNLIGLSWTINLFSVIIYYT